MKENTQKIWLHGRKENKRIPQMHDSLQLDKDVIEYDAANI